MGFLGALGGIASGVSAGASLGPWGMVGGGLLGLATGLFGKPNGDIVSGRDYDINNYNVTPHTQWWSEYQKYSDPNSDYYRKYSNQLSRQLNGSMSSNSLLSLVAAKGGNFAQAQEQIKGMQADIMDKTMMGTEKMYLSGSQMAQNALQQDYGLRQEMINNRMKVKMAGNDQSASFDNNMFALGGGLLSSALQNGSIANATKGLGNIFGSSGSNINWGKGIGGLNNATPYQMQVGLTDLQRQMMRG